MEWWLLFSYRDDRGRIREKRLCAPFRTQQAAEDYRERFLLGRIARRQIFNVQIVPGYTGFFDGLERLTDD